tara:strand:- start:14616 stop:15362 length:747 start_codon:yes stop_codon:yes gene_type:complete
MTDIQFDFDKGESRSYRKDLLTSKGLKDNFSQYEIIPIPQKNLEDTHYPYLFGAEQLDKIYDVISKQNITSWPILSGDDIYEILPLSDFLGLDIVVEHYVNDIRKNMLIKNEKILNLLFDYPQLRGTNSCEYSRYELQFILNTHPDHMDKYPEYLKNSLLCESKKIMDENFNIRKHLVSVVDYYDHRHLREIIKEIFRTITGNEDIHNTGYFKECVEMIKNISEPIIGSIEIESSSSTISTRSIYSYN